MPTIFFELYSEGACGDDWKPTKMSRASTVPMCATRMRENTYLLSRSTEALTPPPVYPFSMKSAALSNLWIGACTKSTKRFLASASILVTREIAPGSARLFQEARLPVSRIGAVPMKDRALEFLRPIDSVGSGSCANRAVLVRPNLPITHCEARTRQIGKRQAPSAGEHIYNAVRPHQALGYLTPLEFLERDKSQQEKAECHESCGRVHSLATYIRSIYTFMGDVDGQSSNLQVRE